MAEVVLTGRLQGNLATGLTQLRDRLGRFTAGVRSAQRPVQQLEGRMTRLGAASAGAAAGLGRIAAIIGGGLAFRRGVTVIAQFEERIATIGAITQQTDEQLQSVIATVRELGATTRFSASEAADAFINLSRAGFSVSESTAAVGQTLNLAIAGQLDLATASDLTASAIRQFGLQAIEAQRVVDALATTANSTNTTIGELGEALKVAGPQAAAFGQDLESTVAALGQLADFGIRGSLAGTNLRGIFASLAEPTNEAQRAVAELGLEIEQLSPSANDLQDIFRALGDSSLSAEQALAIFSRRNAGAALILARTAERAELLEEKIRANEGAAERAAERINNTLLGAFRTLRSTLEEVTLGFGDQGLLGGLTAFTRTATTAVRFLFGLGVTADQVTPGVRALALAFTAVAASLTALLTLRIGAFFLAFSNPITAAITAISLLVGALFAFRDTTFEIRGQTVNLGDVILSTFSLLADRIPEILDAIVLSFRILINTIIGLFVGLGQEIRFQLSDIFANDILGAISGLLAVLPGQSDLREAVERLAENLNPDNLPRQAGERWRQALTQDYVGAIIGGIQDISPELQAELNAIGERLAGGEVIDALIDDIAARAEARRLLRQQNAAADEAAREALEQQAEAEKQALEELRAELTRLSELPEPELGLKDLEQNVESLAQAREELARTNQEINALFQSGQISQQTATRLSTEAQERFNTRLKETNDLFSLIAGNIPDSLLPELSRLEEQIGDLSTGLPSAGEQGDPSGFFRGIADGAERAGQSVANLGLIGRQVGESLVTNLAEGLIDVFARGEQTLREFVRTFLAQTSIMIARLLLIRVLSTALGAGGTAVANIGAAIFGGQQARTGGLIRGVGRGIKRFATGGEVTGPYEANRDTVPAMLQPGEYVINRRAVQLAGGPGVLNALNAGLIPASMLRPFSAGGTRQVNQRSFQSGGAVGPANGGRSPSPVQAVVIPDEQSADRFFAGGLNAQLRTVRRNREAFRSAQRGGA